MCTCKFGSWDSKLFCISIFLGWNCGSLRGVWRGWSMSSSSVCLLPRLISLVHGTAWSSCISLAIIHCECQVWKTNVVRILSWWSEFRFLFCWFIVGAEKGMWWRWLFDLAMFKEASFLPEWCWWSVTQVLFFLIFKQMGSWIGMGVVVGKIERHC